MQIALLNATLKKLFVGAMSASGKFDKVSFSNKVGFLTTQLEVWYLTFKIYIKKQKGVSVCLLPFSIQTTGWIRTKLGIDPGHVLHTFLEVPPPGGV